MKFIAENIGLESSVGEDVLDDDELIKKKEKEIQDAQLKKDIQEAVRECLVGFGQVDTDCVAGKITDLQQIQLSEKRVNRIEESVEGLAKDSLRLSKRVLKLGKDIAQVERDIISVKEDVGLIKQRAQIIKDETEKYETKKDVKWEKRRDTILRVAVIVISIIAVLVSGFSYFKM